MRGHFSGSSPNSGERGPDLEEEVGVIAEAVGHALDDLDLVVDALDQVGPQRPSAVCQDAGQIGFQATGEALQRLDATAHGTPLPAEPELSRPCLTPVAPKLLHPRSEEHTSELQSRE